MPSYKRKRIPENPMSKTAITSAIKRARSAPAIRSKFTLTRRDNPAIFPPRLRQTLVYSETFAITTGALIGIPTTTQWRLNGLNDPRVAVGGHQPMGFDQLMAIYTKYTVLGAKVTVYFAASDAAYYTGDCGINITDPLAVVGGAIDGLIESQYSTYGVYVQSGNATKLSIGLDMGKYFSIKDMLDEADVQGTAATDPLRQVYATIWAGTHKGVAQVVNATIKIEYDTMFVEPRNVPQS